MSPLATILILTLLVGGIAFGVAVTMVTDNVERERERQIASHTDTENAAADRHRRHAA